MPAIGWNRRPSYTVGGTIQLSGAHMPESGTYGDGVGVAGLGSTWFDTGRGTMWVNEGTAAAPYWSPLGLNQPNLWGVFDDFRGEPGVALSDTAGENIFNSGLRVFGQGIAETDAGAFPNTAGEGGVTLRMTTTDEVAHTIAIGTEAGVFQPDQHGLGILDVVLTHVSAITLRGMGIGFVGLAADAFDPPITAATTVATLVQDDLALLHFNVGYTATSRLYFAYNKSDAAPTMTAVSTGVDIAAAGTYQRFRVECGGDGDVRVFVNKVQVASRAIALDVDEEASPVVYIESTSTAVKAMDVRQFLFVAGR